MFFKQIKHMGDNFSYILAEESIKEAVVIDPSFNADVLIQIAKKHGFNIKYVINTHHHSDHVAGNAKIKLNFGSKIVAHKLSKVGKDIEVTEGDKLKVGSIVINIIHTPGHTPDSICLLVDDKLMTGDTMFVGGYGRTDLPGGSSKDLYNSLFNKIMNLDWNLQIYPGHDYGSKPRSTVGDEKRNYSSSLTI